MGQNALVSHAPTAAEELTVHSQRSHDQLSLDSDAHQVVGRWIEAKADREEPTDHTKGSLPSIQGHRGSSVQSYLDRTLGREHRIELMQLAFILGFVVLHPREKITVSKGCLPISVVGIANYM